MARRQEVEILGNKIVKSVQKSLVSSIASIDSSKIASEGFSALS